eukprot:1248462-Rhodomonas_salina.2
MSGTDLAVLAQCLLLLAVSGTDPARAVMPLCTRYAVSGTELLYAPTRLRLHGRGPCEGTVRYGPTPVLGTNPAYGPTRELRDAWY